MGSGSSLENPIAINRSVIADTASISGGLSASGAPRNTKNRTATVFAVFDDIMNVTVLVRF
jgi:hypothetical protein